MAELALQDEEHVLDFRPHLAEAAVACTLALAESTTRLCFTFTAQSTPASSAAHFFSSLA